MTRLTEWQACRYFSGTLAFGSCIGFEKDFDVEKDPDLEKAHRF